MYVQIHYTRQVPECEALSLNMGGENLLEECKYKSGETLQNPN